MSTYRYFPIPSDRMGTLWTIGTIKNAYIIEFGPAGTTHFSIEGFMQLNAQEEANCFTTHLDESDIAFGSHKRLEQSIKEICEIHKPEVIFVMGSSISSIIGIDISSICYMLEQSVDAKLIPIDTGGFKGDFTLGIRNAIKLLCEEIACSSKNKEPKTYNIIGSEVDYFNYKSDIYEIKKIMREVFNCECNCVFTSDTSIEEIKRASEAEFNIVIRSEGIDGAKILKEKFGQEYIEGRPYGLNKTLEWIGDIENTIGLERNEEYVELKKLSVQDAINKANMIAKEYNCEKAIISGNYDIVNGMFYLLREIGIGSIQGVINHNIKGKNYFNMLKEVEEFVNINPSEKCKLNNIKEFNPDVILGDGDLLKVFDNIPKIQISNPNIQKTIFYNKTPFIGFDGCLYILQLLLNEIKSKY